MQKRSLGPVSTGGDEGTVEERSDSPSSGGARYDGIALGGGLPVLETLVGEQDVVRGDREAKTGYDTGLCRGELAVASFSTDTCVSQRSALSGLVTNCRADGSDSRSIIVNPSLSRIVSSPTSSSVNLPRGTASSSSS